MIFRYKNGVPLMLVLYFISFSGCRKFVEVSPPKTQLVTASVFANEETANSAVAGMYSYMYQLNNSISTFGGYHLTISTGLLSDELYQPAIPENPYYANNIPADDDDADKIWQSCYAVIYNANAIIEGLHDANNISFASKNQFIGEALFIRAFCHFYLVNLFGDVPLITTTSVNQTSNAARTSITEIYQQIISDLLQAQGLLAVDYSFSGGERVRANKWVATAFLARVYLYQKDWNDAEIQSASLINNSDLFTLLADLNTIFLENSQEAIWQFLSYEGRGFTTVGKLLSGGSAMTVPTYALTQYQMNAFEPDDQRAIDWISNRSINGQNYYIAFKYKNSTTSSGNVEYDMALRLSEQYLIRSEARAEQGKIPEAADDLNIIRNRAGLPEISITDKDSLLIAIEHESQCEFFAEWGHRWFDLKRTGHIDAVLGSEKPGWKTTAALLPIPQIEISKNPKLNQNPGY